MLPTPSFAFLHSWHLLLPCTFGLLTYSDNYLFHRYVAASNLHHLFIELVYSCFIYFTYVHDDLINKLIMSSTTRYVFMSGVTDRSSSHFIASSKGLLDLYRAWMFKVCWQSYIDILLLFCQSRPCIFRHIFIVLVKLLHSLPYENKYYSLNRYLILTSIILELVDAVLTRLLPLDYTHVA